MIEYANESVVRFLKQYDMLSKSLKITTDLNQKNDLCYQMTKIIQNVLEITNTIYEKKYSEIEKRSVYLMDEEKTRLLELINLINERRTYINNQIINNKELTGQNLDTGIILGEEQLEEYKSRVKIIEKYKNNVKLESILKEELKNLETGINKAHNKIENNDQLNKQLEEKMIKLLENAFEKLSLYELQEREKEIELAYTELGYSLEKAKENAKIARKDYTEEIISECDNMLASITLEYERYKEKKLILKLIYLYKNPTKNYEELLNKREEINNILTNITSSELYSLVGNELNKQYATIKLESQDVATLKSLIEEKELKQQTLEEITVENNSQEFKSLLASLLENEKKHQEHLRKIEQKKEEERLERQRLEEIKKKEEMAKRQQELEEERKKEIERRTKQLLVEKQNPILMTSKEEIKEKEKQLKIEPRKKIEENIFPKKSTSTTLEVEKKNLLEKNINNSTSTRSESVNKSYSLPKDDFFAQVRKNTKVVDQGIPVIKNNNLDNEIVTAKKQATKAENIFPEIKLEKKESIFPELPNSSKNSFFDEDEFKDLSNYMEDDNKKSWF